MRNERGFIGVGVLIAIVLGMIVIGGAVYYVMHQSAVQQTQQNLPELTTTQQTLPARPPEQPQSAQVTQAATTSTATTGPTISITTVSGNTVTVHYSGLNTTIAGTTTPTVLSAQNDGWSKPEISVPLDGSPSGTVTLDLPANGETGNFTIYAVGMPVTPYNTGIGDGSVGYDASADFYVSSDGSISIGKPTALLTASPTTGTVPLVVNFSVEASNNSPVVPTSISFGDVSENGSTPLSSCSSGVCTHTYMRPGTYTAEIDGSDVSLATTTVVVTGPATLKPSITIDQNSLTDTGSNSITITGTANVAYIEVYVSPTEYLSSYIPVTNGRWAATVSNLKSGKNEIDIYGYDYASLYGEYGILATSTFMVQ